jgi:hypothetical protein
MPEECLILWYSNEYPKHSCSLTCSRVSLYVSTFLLHLPLTR